MLWQGHDEDKSENLRDYELERRQNRDRRRRRRSGIQFLREEPAENCGVTRERNHPPHAKSRDSRGRVREWLCRSSLKDRAQNQSGNAPTAWRGIACHSGATRARISRGQSVPRGTAIPSGRIEEISRRGGISPRWLRCGTPRWNRHTVRLERCARCETLWPCDSSWRFALRECRRRDSASEAIRT